MIIKNISLISAVLLHISITFLCQSFYANQNGQYRATSSNHSSFIQKIQSFKDVNFDTIQPDSLVVFDVDDTLIQPVDTILINAHTAQAKKFLEWLKKTYPIDWDLAGSVFKHWQLYKAKSRLIEPSIIDTIEQLKTRDIPVIACTFIYTGYRGGTKEPLEKWRYNHLKSLGFEGSYTTKIIKFDVDNNHPVFYKGILATDKVPKGIAIGAFLDAIGVHPKIIIMFDDTYDFLFSVQQECISRGIIFQGYQCQGAKPKAWDEDLIKFQGRYLVEHGQWLSDQEAQNMRTYKNKPTYQISPCPEE
jgi:hypothetical protein